MSQLTQQLVLSGIAKVGGCTLRVVRIKPAKYIPHTVSVSVHVRVADTCIEARLVNFSEDLLDNPLNFKHTLIRYFEANGYTVVAVTRIFRQIAKVKERLAFMRNNE